MRRDESPNGATHYVTGFWQEIKSQVERSEEDREEEQENKNKNNKKTKKNKKSVT